LAQTHAVRLNISTAEHNYALIRLLKTDAIDMNAITLDMLCVACHYSSRYQSSENYLLKYCDDDAVINYITYLKQMTPDSLIDMFIGEYVRITPTSLKVTAALGQQQETVVQDIQVKSSSITWKNMQYLWKHFLDTKNIPNVVFASKFKSQVTEILQKYYVAEEEVFVGVYSKYLPSVCKFLQFWNDTMVFDEDELELETSEISALFKVWLESKGETRINMSDKQVMDLIHFYYPEVDTEGDKYVYKVKNKLWDKQMEVHMALATETPTSSYDAYVKYCAYKKRQAKNLPIVSKQYFDKVYDTKIE
jgi:hypothetical protein